MQVAEKHHTDPNRPLSRPGNWRFGLLMPVLLFLITAGFYWKLVLTDQYTWLESPDLANQVLPWLQFQAGEWHRGSFPLWDPYHWGGQSLIGQAQPGAAYPPNWILFLLPLRNGWIRLLYLHWYFVVIHFLAVLFCYLLCRELKRSRAASLLGGLAFAFVGYIGTTDWPQMLNGAVWAPLVFLFLLRALDGVRPTATAALAGMFLGISWLSGHHQIPIYTTLAAGGVWLYHILRHGRPDWRLVRLAAVFALFLSLTGALQMLPAYEYGKLSRRWVGVPDPVGWNEKVPYIVHADYALYPLSVLGIVIPGIHRHANPFAGVVAVSLALLALALAPHARAVRLFGLVAVAGLLFSLGHNNVLHGFLYAVVPLVEKARSPSMAIFIFHFGLAVLVAFGADALFSDDDSKWTRRVATGLGVFALALFAISAMAVILQRPDDRYALSALIALLTAGVLWGRSNKYISAGATAVFCALLFLTEAGNVSGYAFAHKLDKNRNVYLKKMSEHSDIVGFLRERPWPQRVEVDDSSIPYNFGDWYGVDVFGGYVASLPDNLLRLGMHGERVRMLMGVKYSIGPKPTRGNQQEAFRGSAGLNVYENPGAFPRVWSVHEVFAVASENQIHQFTDDPGFDLRRKAFLFGTPPGLEKCREEDSVRLVSREPARIVIEADMACKGMVVVSDNYFPGWVATVDGKSAKIYEAYTVIRGVVVDRGRHTVEMRYRPWSVYAGAVMTALGVFGACGLAIVSRRRSV